MSKIDSIDALIASKVAERNDRITRNERMFLVAEKNVREACERMGLRIESSKSDPDEYCDGLIRIKIFVPCKCAGKRYVLFGERGFDVNFYERDALAATPESSWLQP